MRGAALLLKLQRLIERTYDLDTGIADISPFIIGDAGYRRFYLGREIVAAVPAARRAPAATLFASGSAAPAGAKTLLREEAGALRLSLYYPDSMVANLERHDPARRLAEGNVDDFAVLVEELDHLLTIADRHRGGASMSLLELELHANVTKELTVELFVARGMGLDRLGAGERAWVRHHLFHKVEYAEDDPEIQSRYKDAAALAVRYLDYLLTLPAAERPGELRRFHRRTHHEKLAHISQLSRLIC